MKRFSTFLAALAAMAAAAPAGAQEQCTSMQVLLSISPKHRENVMEYIAPRLKQKLGIDLITEVVGSAPMVERITAQMPNPRITIAHWDVAVGLTACDNGLCKPIDLAKVPTAQKLLDWAYTRDAAGETTMLATNVIGIGLLYNEAEFKKNNIPPPTSWDDLTKPALKGRVSIVAPASTWGTALLAHWAKLGGGGETNVEPAFAKVKAMIPAMHTIHTWSSELSNLMQLGEVWMAASGSNMAPSLRSQGLPIRWVVPKEGSPIVNGGVSLVKGAPCEAAAYEYLNLFYSDDFQVMRIRDGGLASPSPSAWDKLSPDEKANMDLTPADFAKLADYDWKRINADRAEWIKRWQREIR